MTQRFADWLAYGIFGLDAASSLGTAVNFFFYDSIKIIILLFCISFVMGIINAYFPIERLRAYLSTHKLYGLTTFLQPSSEALPRSAPAHRFLCS